LVTSAETRHYSSRKSAEAVHETVTWFTTSAVYRTP